MSRSPRQKECTAYIIDTVWMASTNKFLPGAITYIGRKRMETIQWKARLLDTQTEADELVRRHFEVLGISEAHHEGELRSK